MINTEDLHAVPDARTAVTIQLVVGTYMVVIHTMITIPLKMYWIDPAIFQVECATSMPMNKIL